MDIYQYPEAEIPQGELIRRLKCSCGSKRGFEIFIDADPNAVTCFCRGCGLQTEVQPIGSVVNVMGPAKLKKIKKEV